ncbi:hypothetical protein PSHT_16375 [Puccinia striiformis]|uniref:Secreted protein n=1 Tax=Puccinia striiformis TaxID=27350 RepID=A0A2S4UA74_9BASI|nr:hypothetical protein PSHT_16375 [Puccinia striiformis]
MSIMNLFKRGYIIVALFALIITLHEDQVSAGTKVDCTYHFWPSPDSPRASCISQDDPKKDHSCALDSCRTPLKGKPPHQTTTSWFELTFQHCHIGTAPVSFINVQQYFRREGFVCNFREVADHCILLQPPRTARATGWTAITRTIQTTINTSPVATAAKHTLFPLAGFKQTENCASLQHLR